MELVGLAFAFVSLVWVAVHHLCRPAPAKADPAPAAPEAVNSAIDMTLARLQAHDERLKKVEVELNTLKSALALKQSFGK